MKFWCTYLIKENLLFQKAYKSLYHGSSGSGRQSGTLYSLKNKLRRTNVNGKVKSNFSAHEELLLTVTESLIKEQAFAYFGMEEESSAPTKNCVENPQAMKTEEAITMLENFVRFYGYAQFDLQEKAPPPAEASALQAAGQRRVYVQAQLPNGQIVLLPATMAGELPQDHVYNYSMNVCHWGLHLMQMNDTAKEGDLNRTIVNLKYCIPFFFSHSRLSKYFVECLDYLRKVCYTLSPQQRLRTLEGSFVNSFGGKGNNVEADLRQEHSVCNSKELIRQLGANKTESAITRVTGAADTVSKLVDYINYSMEKPSGFAQHKKPVSDEESRKSKGVGHLLESEAFSQIMFWL